ncbi:hypothetical protein [Bradyrhizobium sp. JYMT SZCCT0428]|uniref:hypothetical protein n=1 Tax=Bradyrhizobium sp. JYMT SZCCT0428 TaxID=2807673 RepID=UPI001BA98C44|nr:hypothetical protein [Bradyrhizobium sp. JYMT SZCCT0428]MBR1154182.1 hypothetical protein [Bradyrhizobium sp. JYMT SZCCT0428]
MTEADQIPIIGHYRGVALHDQQSPERLEAVRHAIDRVYDQHDLDRLLQIAGDPIWPPEARLFAAAKLEAIFEIAVEGRKERPSIDLMRVQASVVGLNSVNWRNPWAFGSLLDPGPEPGKPGAAKRETPLV